MSRVDDWEKVEQWVLEAVWERGYRQITGSAWFQMSAAICNWMDGYIGKTTARRKVKRQFRCLKRALNRPNVKRFDIQQVSA